MFLERVYARATQWTHVLWRLCSKVCHSSLVGAYKPFKNLPIVPILDIRPYSLGLVTCTFFLLIFLFASISSYCLSTSRAQRHTFPVAKLQRSLEYDTHAPLSPKPEASIKLR